MFETLPGGEPGSEPQQASEFKSAMRSGCAAMTSRTEAANTLLSLRCFALCQPRQASAVVSRGAKRPPSSYGSNVEENKVEGFWRVIDKFHSVFILSKIIGLMTLNSYFFYQLRSDFSCSLSGNQQRRVQSPEVIAWVRTGITQWDLNFVPLTLAKSSLL
jgi:hypothetical protein